MSLSAAYLIKGKKTFTGLVLSVSNVLGGKQVYGYQFYPMEAPAWRSLRLPAIFILSALSSALELTEARMLLIITFRKKLTMERWQLAKEREIRNNEHGMQNPKLKTIKQYSHEKIIINHAASYNRSRRFCTKQQPV